MYALELVKSTRYDIWMRRFEVLHKVISSAGAFANIFTGDLIGGVSSIARNFASLAELYDDTKKPSWFDKTNLVIGMQNESMFRIRNVLFAPKEERMGIKAKGNVFIDVKKDEIITFYVI